MIDTAVSHGYVRSGRTVPGSGAVHLERTLRLLTKNGALTNDATARGFNQPIFYAWQRDHRLVLVFNPLLLKDPDTALSPRFRHHLFDSAGAGGPVL